MGEMATLAQQHHEKYLPEVAAALTDPEGYYQGLESQAQDLIDQYVDQEAETTVPGETFSQRAGRLSMAQSRGREQAMREVICPAPTPAPEVETPEDRDLAEALAEFQTALGEMPDRAPTQ